MAPSTTAAATVNTRLLTNHFRRDTAHLARSKESCDVTRARGTGGVYKETSPAGQHQLRWEHVAALAFIRSEDLVRGNPVACARSPNSPATCGCRSCRGSAPAVAGIDLVTPPETGRSRGRGRRQPRYCQRRCVRESDA